jgi:hypothetical protein
MDDQMSTAADDQALARRLQAFEASVPVSGGPPQVQRTRLPRVRTALVGVAAVAVLAGGAGAASGVFEARSRPGAFNAGEPLHCTGVAAMEPRAADAWLRDHGYRVTWQVEDHEPGVPKGQQGSYQSTTPPRKGTIEGAVFTSRRDVLLVVETGPNAVQADDCP